MSQKDETILTEHGNVTFTIYECDTCGKKETSNDRGRWLRTHPFFRDYEWLLRTPSGGTMTPVEWMADACSIECFKPLMADALNKFAELWVKGVEA